jgi:SagB-type dehydrogenase family enzyme
MENLQEVLLYHQATKHHFGRFARGPGQLDWATQPDPFRRYLGARQLNLEVIPPGEHPAYEPPFWTGQMPPEPLTFRTISRLFFDSLAISAWKRAGNTSWALRVNPSSGNLHPTEGYLICGPVAGLTDVPLVVHYAPRQHALEVRAELPPETWQGLVADLPPATILVGLSSIHWREAWKYGERAFRYCQHDVGHALAAIGIAAAGLGWQATLLDDLGSAQIAQLLGLDKPHEAEAEHPDCLLAVCPQGDVCTSTTLPQQRLEAVAHLAWQGNANPLSPAHRSWALIDEVATATIKPATSGAYSQEPAVRGVAISGIAEGEVGLHLRRIIHQRRSAVAMDPRGHIERDAFYRMLYKTLAGPDHIPFNMLPWSPVVHLVLFAHRIRDLVPGLYVLLRDHDEKRALQSATRSDFTWERPATCPENLNLYRLLSGDARSVARQLSCQQAIASDGCFSLGMLTKFEEPLERYGAWFYRRLFWECGMIGQVLYLEAEAAGLRGTGIGCFFDDPVHELLGLTAQQYQSLYHFTVGQPVEDTRITTLPAYPSRPPD